MTKHLWKKNKTGNAWWRRWCRWCHEAQRTTFLPRFLNAGWNSSTNVSRTEEESVSEVHESEHEIVGRGVRVGECRRLGRQSFSSTPKQTDGGFFSLAKGQSNLIMESMRSSSSKYKQDLETKCRSTPAIAGWGGVATHERTWLATRENSEEGFVWGVEMESVRIDEVLYDSDRTCSLKSREMGLWGVWIGRGGDCEQDGLRVEVQSVGGSGFWWGRRSFGGRGGWGSKSLEDEDLMEIESSSSRQYVSHSASDGIWAAQARMPWSSVPWNMQWGWTGAECGSSRAWHSRPQ